MPTPVIHNYFLGTIISTLAMIASFLFDQELAVVVASGAGAYYAAYRSNPAKWWKYIIMIGAGIFLGTLSVKGVNWLGGMIFDKWSNPPAQIVGLIFGYVWIYEPVRTMLLNAIVDKFKALISALGVKS